MSEMIRSFLAFDIANEEILQRFAEVQERLIRSGADLKIVNPQNIHITIRFLGNVSPNTIEQVYEAMKEVPFKPYKIMIKGLGTFPSLEYIRIVWAGIEKGAKQLKDVFDHLEPRLQRVGFKPDRKGFSPHLTIARVRSARYKARLVQCIKELENYEFGEFGACILRLKRSILKPAGPIYSTIHEVKAIENKG
ncbi:MAG: RNA 2',3'-cyclic phosphodiesterase [Candidatus Bathyarchaeota archaeon]|nr:MAG: RNA 2',3'-cyclic phosphodiesterase [Candidatus Bathyarchaeota archaeon]